MGTKPETLDIEMPEGPRTGLHGKKKWSVFICYSLIMIVSFAGLIYSLTNHEADRVIVESKLNEVKTMRPTTGLTSTLPPTTTVSTTNPTTTEASTKCSTGFKPTSKGFCVESKFPFACSASEPCPADLICHQGNCSCKYPEHQEYVPEEIQCESKVGGPCGPEIHCLKFSECRLFSNRSTGLCKCRQGTTVNLDFKCDQDYPIDCKYSEDCKPLANFDCIEGTCTCKAGTSFVKEEGACVRLVGSSCQIYRSNIPCVKNAGCISLNDNWYTDGHDNGICKCDSEYEISSDFTCQKVADLIAVRAFH